MPETLVLFLVFYVAFQHFVSPLLVWATNYSPCRYSFPSIGWREAIESADAELEAAHLGLEACSFYPVAASGFGSSLSSMFFIVYRHPTDSALVTVMRGKNWLGTLTTVDFTQTYADGTHLSLSNSAMPSVFPRWEKRQGPRLPGLNDINELFARFNALRGRFQGPEVAAIAEGKELELLEDSNNAQADHLCQIGHMAMDCTPKGRRFTLVGAYRSSWRMLHPWKWISLRLDRAEALRRTAI